MPALDSLLKRFGFVRLSRYGLVLTPEGRIMSMRPAVLDDGLGGRVVGWPDNDLAAVELAEWEPARPASHRAIATRVAAPTMPFAAPRAAAPAKVVIPERVVAIPTPRAVAPIAPRVAAAPQVDEDEWEWEIALARARAVAEEAVAAVETATAPRRHAETVPPPTTPAPAPSKFVPVKTEPMLSMPRDSGTWPTTVPIGNIDYSDYTDPAREVARVPPKRPTPAPVARAASPATVIPVPRLPSMKTSPGVRIAPVVRSAPPPVPAEATRRFAKGTGPVVEPAIGPEPTSVGIAVAPLPPPIRPGEDPDRTVPGAPALAIGDHTKPGIALPKAAGAVALPSIRSRFAR